MQGDILRERDEFIGVRCEIVVHGELDEYVDLALVAVALDVAIEHGSCGRLESIVDAYQGRPHSSDLTIVR